MPEAPTVASERIERVREEQPNDRSSRALQTTCGEVVIEGDSPRWSTDARGDLYPTPGDRLQATGADYADGIYVGLSPQISVAGHRRYALLRKPVRSATYAVGARVRVGEEWLTAETGGLTGVTEPTPEGWITQPDGEVTWALGGPYIYRGPRLDSRNSFIAPVVDCPVAFMDLWPIASEPIFIRLVTGADLCLDPAAPPYSIRRKVHTFGIPFSVIADDPFRLVVEFSARIRVVVNGELLMEADNPTPLARKPMKLGGVGRGDYYAFNLVGVRHIPLRVMRKFTQFD